MLLYGLYAFQAHTNGIRQRQLYGHYGVNRYCNFNRRNYGYVLRDNGKTKKPFSIADFFFLTWKVHR